MARDARPPLPPEGGTHPLRNMTSAAFAALGAEGLAYIKSSEVDGERLFKVYLADGREIATMAHRDLAEVMARQNDLEPVSVH